MDDRPFRPWSPRTVAANALAAIEPHTGALTQPIHIATTYVRDADNRYSAGFVYGRPDNATIRQLEALLADLEHAEEAMMFSSGMAAATAVFLSLPPTHVVAPRRMYWGLRQWLRGIARYGHDIVFVDMENPAAVRAAILPGKTGTAFWPTRRESHPFPDVTISSTATATASTATSAASAMCQEPSFASGRPTRNTTLAAQHKSATANGNLNRNRGVCATARISGRIPTPVRNRTAAIAAPARTATSKRRCSVSRIGVPAPATRPGFQFSRIPPIGCGKSP